MPAVAMPRPPVAPEGTDRWDTRPSWDPGFHLAKERRKRCPNLHGVPIEPEEARSTDFRRKKKRGAREKRENWERAGRRMEDPGPPPHLYSATLRAELLCGA